MKFIWSILKRFIFLINIACILLLLATYLAPKVNPSIFSGFAFVGLFYPVILILNVIFVFFWFISLSKNGFFSLIAILIGNQHISEYIQFNSADKTTNTENINIISHNVGIFGFFLNQWYVSETINKIKEKEPQIVVIQEFLYIYHDNQISTIDSFKNILKLPHVYFEKLNDGRKKGEYGMLILSKFPIINKGLVHFDQYTGNMCCFADLKINNKIKRVYNIHLQSYKFYKKDWKFFNDIAKADSLNVEEAKGVVNKMKNAMINRSKQVKIINEHIDNFNSEDYIICGDFNDPPLSYSYKKLKRKHNDAFVKMGNGFESTFIGKIPMLRIDYIFVSKSAEIKEYESYKVGSDHKMIFAKFKFKD